MPRFVVLEHDRPELHWDLMLEVDGVLRTWRLTTPLRAGQELAAGLTFDHRLLYLDYEGPLSGDHGQVIRREQGTCNWLMQSADLVAVRLEGEGIHGVLRMERTDADNWRGEFRADPVAS